MARNMSGVYSLPPGSLVTNGDTSDATDLNTPLQDIETDMNTARPVVAGGTGATSAADARTNLAVPGTGATETITGDWTFEGDLFYTGAVTASKIQQVGSYRSQPLLSEGYYSVEYSSDRTDANIYGYTANVKRLDGGDRPVAAQLNAYDLSTSGTPDTVFGIACEAWTGDATTNAAVAAGVKGIEPAIIQQYHDSDATKWGVDVVFKNRRDAGTLLHGSIGNNKFNYGSRAINISSQARTAFGEYCGWKTGIYFADVSLDADVDGAAIGIDISQVPTARLAYAMLLGENQYIGFSENHATRDVKMRYLDSADVFQISDGSVERFGIQLSGSPYGIRLNSTQVVTTRRTGWTAPTGTASRATFDTASTSLELLAERLKALIDDLTTHGLIGP